MDGQKDGTDDFRAEREQDNTFDEAENILAGRMGKQILHGHALTKRDASADPSEQRHGNGHYAQSADLNKRQDHALSEHGEIASRVHHYQTGDAYGGRGRKQRIHPRD